MLLGGAFHVAKFLQCLTSVQNALPSLAVVLTQVVFLEHKVIVSFVQSSVIKSFKYLFQFLNPALNGKSDFLHNLQKFLGAL